uniref:C2H2-type domain-containing protein n=1 Tax=Acrobeloides nanus TaxID=290746 RepID=A0A914D6W0_9BILA
MKNFRAYLKNLIYTKCEPDDLPPRLSPQHMPDIPPLKKNADFSRKIENFDADAFGGFSDTYSNQIIMDELGNQYTLVPEQELPSTSKVQDIQEVYDISTDQEDHAYDSYKYPSLTQNIELEEMIGSPDPPRLKPYGVVDHENVVINSMFKSTNRVFRKRLKYGTKNKKELVPKCYICFRVLKNAEHLAHHLLNAHVNTKKSSFKSGSKCSRKPKREAQ